jgi:predicted nucleic acid-binding protein
MTSKIALPAISAYEVWVRVLGLQNPKRRREELETFLSVVEILPFDAEVRKNEGVREKRGGQAYTF